MDPRFNRLPELMRSAIDSLKQLHNTPDSLAMPAVLGVANAAVMPHYMIDPIVFAPKPLSLFIVCLLPTGMRKSTTYDEITAGIIRYQDEQKLQVKDEQLRFKLDEKEFERQLKQYQKDIDTGIGATLPEPPRPRKTAEYIIPTGTLNGIKDKLVSQPFLSLFSSEAGEFFNSHSFQGSAGANRAIEMCASLTSLWDGKEITKLTGMQNLYLPDRAINMMFFLQEAVVREFLNNPMFSDQGFVHRILIAQSDYVEPPDMDVSDQGLERIAKLKLQLRPFHEHIYHLINQPIQTSERDYAIQNRRILKLSALARDCMQDYYNNYCKNQSRGALHDWVGYSERLLEHMLRIAGTLAAFERQNQVMVEHIQAARDVMDFFTEQRLTLELGVTSQDQPHQQKLARLRNWIEKKAWAGTQRELRRSVRWFNELTPDEQTRLLADLVKSDVLELSVTRTPQNIEKVTYQCRSADNFVCAAENVIRLNH